MENHKRKKQAKTLRFFRKIHRITGVSLLLIFLVMSISGILLGWKKNSYGVLQAKSHQGTSTNLKEWLPISSLHSIATKILADSISPSLSSKISRIDIRKEKGMAKFIYQDHYWSIQLDGATGKLLNLSLRRSDFIEAIHDGSIFDSYFGTSNSQFKLFYTSISGLALLVFIISGFWLWYGPKRMKHLSRGHS